MGANVGLGARRTGEIQEDGCIDRPILHRTVKRLKNVGTVVEGEARHQDAMLSAGEELADHHGGVAGGAACHVGAGPDQVDGNFFGTTALCQHGIDHGEHGAAIETYEGTTADVDR
jgi:hypothetical protein